MCDATHGYIHLANQRIRNDFLADGLAVTWKYGEDAARNCTLKNKHNI